MEPSQVRRALEAARSTARELGLQINEAVVVYNSDRIAVRLVPCNVLVRIGPQGWEDSFRFEAEVVRRLAEIGGAVGDLEPRAGPRVYLRDGFALTFWAYYEQVDRVTPATYADALLRLHASLRQIDMRPPHITERIDTWVTEVNDPEQTPELPDRERERLSATFHRVLSAINLQDTDDQLLHGEPHPGNLLSTSRGPLFIDFHTCQRGPVEYDIAFTPEKAWVHYPGVNQPLVRQFHVLIKAGFVTTRWRSGDQFPDRDHWRLEGLKQFREALDRA